MQNNDNYYWYKERPSHARRSAYRLSLPVTALLVIVFFGFQPVFSESNNTTNLGSSNSSNTESEAKPNFSGNTENYIAKDKLDNSSEQQNSASITDNEVSIQVDDSSRASISQSESNISISVKNSSVSQQETSAENPSLPNLVINGEEVSVPNNGRVNKVLRDDSSTTRLRTNIDSDGSSSIRIDSSSN